MSRKDLAIRTGTSVNTVRRLEEDSPGTALPHLARALQVFEELDRLAHPMDTAQDSVGPASADECLTQRGRIRRARPIAF